MNKSVMKCYICNNENIGEFITINNKKYHLCCIEQLQQENQELKKQVDEYKKQLKPNYYVKGLEGTLKEYQQENQELNKQLEEHKIKYFKDTGLLSENIVRRF